MNQNLVEYMSVYRDGQEGYVVVETGMPQANVRVGVGDSLREAYDSLESTPIQSVGRDCGLGDALEWAEMHLGISSRSDLEEVDDATLYPEAR